MARGKPGHQEHRPGIGMYNCTMEGALNQLIMAGMLDAAAKNMMVRCYGKSLQNTVQVLMRALNYGSWYLANGGCGDVF